MVRDTLASLDKLPRIQQALRRKLPSTARARLRKLEAAIRVALDPSEAYSGIPGRDPHFG